MLTFQLWKTTHLQTDRQTCTPFPLLHSGLLYHWAIHTLSPHSHWAENRSPTSYILLSLWGHMSLLHIKLMNNFSLLIQKCHKLFPLKISAWHLHLRMPTPIYTIGISIIQGSPHPFKTVSDKWAQKVIVHKEAPPAHSLSTRKATRVYEGSNNLNS